MDRVTEKLLVKNYVDVANASAGIIKPEQIRLLETDAIVDTGATYVCLSRKNIETLGLPFHNTINIKTANGKASRRTFEGAKIELKGRSFRSEEHTSELQSQSNLVCRLLLEKN